MRRQSIPMLILPIRSARSHQRQAARPLRSMLACIFCLLVGQTGSVFAEVGLARSDTGLTTANQTAPIFWKQYVFSIPYKVNRPPNAADAPTEVRLFVSTDRGQSWNEASRVSADVRGFTYHAPHDGEYWFALQTVDRRGAISPASNQLSKLQVVVDTHAPEVQLEAAVTSAGAVSVAWRTVDANPSPSSLEIKVQTDNDAAWRPIPLNELASGVGDMASYSAVDSSIDDAVALRDGTGILPEGRAIWTPPIGAATARFRATITDRAGNQSETTAQVSIARTPDRTAMLPGSDSRIAQQPDESDTSNSNHGSPSENLVHAPLSQNPFESATPAFSSEMFNAQRPVAETPDGATRTVPRTDMSNQSWPEDASVDAPSEFRANVATSTLTVENPFARREGVHPTMPQSVNNAAPLHAQRVIAPPIIAPTFVEQTDQTLRDPNDRLAARPDYDQRIAANDPHSSTWRTLPASGIPLSGSNSSVEPSPQASQLRPASPPPADLLRRPQQAESAANRRRDLDVDVQMVNSRSFSLDYEVQTVGPWGVRRVELWGTTDNGANWRLFGEDADQRSPVEVAVEGEGEYGFRIVVHGAGSYGAATPRPGDAPDVRVRVDLKVPSVTIGSVQRGRGNQADQVTIRWAADDEFLSTNPISLHFAGHPAGPWTTIATRLENTGFYTWRLEQYVPERLYLRVEARDDAGNVGAYSTADPILFERQSPTGRIHGVRPN